MTLISCLMEHDNSVNSINSINNITSITGHLVRLDDRKSIVFGEVRDGSCITTHKFVYMGKKSKSPEDIVKLRETPVGSSVTLTGSLVAAPASATQKYELLVHSAVIHSEVRHPETYRYGLKAHKKMTPEELTQHLTVIRSDPYTRFRDKTFQAIIRVRGQTYAALTNYFNEHGFTKIDAPILTASDCEGAGEMFQVTSLDLDNIPKNDKDRIDYTKDFFGKPMFLTVSGQLEVEAAARDLGKVYSFGRTFRAEHSKTSRHLAEFEMLEPEERFTDPDPLKRYHQLLDRMESMLVYVFKWLLDICKDDLEYLSDVTELDLLTKLYAHIHRPFDRITYTEALEILQVAVKTGHVFEDMNLYWGMDLGSEHERYLCECIHRGAFAGPVFITHYPQSLKSFYMKADQDCSPDRQTCQAVDLLVPGIGELCGGSMREDNPDKLLSVMKQRGMEIEPLQWYVDLRYDGGMPTGGFGLGFARLVAYVTGMSNIKDVVPFPRAY